MDASNIVEEVQSIQAPENLKDKVTAVVSVNLTEKEVYLTSVALHALGKQIEIDGLQELRKVTMMFTEDGEVVIKMLPLPILSDYSSLCIYAVNRWRQQYGQDDGAILIILLEELCRHFYSDDDVLVREAVYKTMKNIFPDLKMNQIYEEEKV